MSEVRYVPGKCNIGPREIRLRNRLGWTSAVVAGVLWIGLAVFGLSQWLYLLVFFPAAISASGFIQGHTAFCAGFGFSGVFNFGPNAETMESVDPEFRNKDRHRARAILAYSFVIGLAVALIAVFVH